MKKLTGGLIVDDEEYRLVPPSETGRYLVGVGGTRDPLVSLFVTEDPIPVVTSLLKRRAADGVDMPEEVEVEVYPLEVCARLRFRRRLEFEVSPVIGDNHTAEREADHGTDRVRCKDGKTDGEKRCGDGCLCGSGGRRTPSVH